MRLAGKTALASGKGQGGVTRIMTAKGALSEKDHEKRIWVGRVVPTLERGAGIMRAGESTAGGVGAALEAEAERGGGKGTTKGEEG